MRVAEKQAVCIPVLSSLYCIFHLNTCWNKSVAMFIWFCNIYEQVKHNARSASFFPFLFFSFYTPPPKSLSNSKDSWMMASSFQSCNSITVSRPAWGGSCRLCVCSVSSSLDIKWWHHHDYKDFRLSWWHIAHKSVSPPLSVLIQSFELWHILSVLKSDDVCFGEDPSRVNLTSCNMTAGLGTSPPAPQN